MFIALQIPVEGLKPNKVFVILNGTLLATETFYSGLPVTGKRGRPVIVVTENINPIWILIVCFLTCNS